jgi:hypothetical protein
VLNRGSGLPGIGGLGLLIRLALFAVSDLTTLLIAASGEVSLARAIALLTRIQHSVS